MASEWINPRFLIFSQILLLTRELTPENWLIYMQNLRINQIFASNSRNNSIYSETLYRHAFSFGPFVQLILSSSQRPQSPSQPSPKRACPRVRQAPALNFCSQKSSQITPARRQKSTKCQQKKSPGWLKWITLDSSFLLKNLSQRCSERTKLGAELGRFWVGRGQICCCLF